MNPSPDWSFYLSAVQWLATIALGITVWLRKPGEDAAKAVAELRDEVERDTQGLSGRLTTIEERVQHMPTSEELAEVKGTVNTVSAQIQGMTDSVHTMRTQLNRIEDYLLKARV